jgi:hypothetical protein
MTTLVKLDDRAPAPALTEREARALTEEVKADAHALWEKYLRLYEGEAHVALGYPSWAAYREAEFGGSKSHAYRLLEAARVVRELPESPTGERPSERQARELAPLRDKPEQMAEAWEEASANGKPTAEKVREAVGRRMASESDRRKAPAAENGQSDGNEASSLPPQSWSKAHREGRVEAALRIIREVAPGIDIEADHAKWQRLYQDARPAFNEIGKRSGGRGTQ